MRKACRFARDIRGDAVVEATILFPIMTMIFAVLVLLAIYLPSQALLQQSTQYAATALATEISDTWLTFDAENMSYRWETDKRSLPNVFESLFISHRGRIYENGPKITEAMESRNLSARTGELLVISRLSNAIIYKEITVEAYKTYRMPVTLTFVGFPKEIVLSASSTSVVQNADEFIRNVDIAADFANFVIEKFELGDITQCFDSLNETVKSIFGW